MEEKKTVVARSIILGIVFIVLGILAIIFRQPVVDAITTFLKWVIGGILIIAGIVNIVFFVKDRQKVPSLIIGILSIAAGVLMFCFNLIDYRGFLRRYDSFGLRIQNQGILCGE